MQTAERVTTAQLTELLLRARNADGGWGYHARKTSRLEPTCWAALALHRAHGDSADALENWPARDGLLLERRDGDPNFAFHALALLALQACRLEHETSNASLVAGMQRVEGLTFDDSPYFRQNNRLVGWSWVAGTFGWVEPTAWCLLALKKARRAGLQVDADRVDQAERLLIDRTCQPGGWNYGNSNALGQQLQPYVPTTAIALLAMQDRREYEAVTRAVAFLDREATSERSGSALALALLAMRLYVRQADAVRRALDEQLPVTAALGNLAAAAMALYALEIDQSADAFRI